MGFQSIIAPGNDGILQFDLKDVGKLYPSGGLHYASPERKTQRYSTPASPEQPQMTAEQ